MMKHINSGAHFTIKFATLDAQRNKPSRVITIAKCFKHYSTKDKEIPANGNALAPLRNSAKPHHDYHGTINVKLPNHSIAKVHTYLITHFNNQPVIM